MLRRKNRQGTVIASTVFADKGVVGAASLVVDEVRS